ncbi:hypothetical protein [Vibrio fortis]|uniref:hypothetical protein n=1 Tax=Vibrio fortis TaxID=212667 RepID=UPI0038CD799A
MLKQLTTLTFSFLIAVSAAHANNDLNTLSPTYDAKARYEMSDNDVKSFVYQWFAEFDHQRESGYFVNRIAQPVNMQYPGTPINSVEAFLAWYQGVTDNIIWNSHDIVSMDVQGDLASGWTVSYDVRWQATSKTKEKFDMMVHQELEVIRVGDALKLAKLEATVVE